MTPGDRGTVDVPGSADRRPAQSLGQLAAALRRTALRAAVGAALGAGSMLVASLVVSPEYTASARVYSGWLGAYRPTIVDGVLTAMNEEPWRLYTPSAGVTYAVVPMNRTELFIRTYAPTAAEAQLAAEQLTAAYLGEVDRLTVAELARRAMLIGEAADEAQAATAGEIADMQDRAERLVFEIGTAMAATAAGNRDAFWHLLSEAQTVIPVLTADWRRLERRRQQIRTVLLVAGMVAAGVQFVPVSTAGAGETLQEATELATAVPLPLPDDTLPDGAVIAGAWSAAYGHDLPRVLNEPAAMDRPLRPRRLAWFSVGVIFGAVAGLFTMFVGDRRRGGRSAA